MNDFNLIFQGFHPSEFTRAYLGDKLSAIHLEAPYGSNLKAVFTRKDRLFKGVVTISSSAGRFFAMASGYKIREVTHRLVSQMRRKLNKWKSQRFDNGSLKNIVYQFEERVHEPESVA